MSQAKLKNRIGVMVATVMLILLALAGTGLTGARAYPAVVPPMTFGVTNLNDSGPGSLRQAITNANANPGADTITFSVTGMIVLTSGEVVISGDLTLLGPGAASLAISGNQTSRIFTVSPATTARISGVTIRDGKSLNSGVAGAIFNDGGTLVITSSILTNNSTTNAGNGGAIDTVGGVVTITNSTLSNNACGLGGGAIRNDNGTVTVTNSTLSNNSSINGGGLDNNGGTLTLTNCTLSGNSAGSGDGGAIVIDSGTANISNCTLADNSAGGGGGFFNFGTVNIKNSIVANNMAIAFGNNCANEGTLNASGVNLSTDSSCSGFTQVTSTQLKLGPLQVNAPGTTATYALLPGSVAIDAVTDCTDVSLNPVSQDQRGVARPQDGNGDGVSRCDVGAYEASAAFDLCIQDDSSGSLLQINTTSGVYQFSNCAGLTLGGTGTITRKGGSITLQQNAGSHRLLAKIDTATKKATATIQILSTGQTFSITDRDITNNTCTCR